MTKMIGVTYITGYFQLTVDFGGGNITAAGGTNIFVLKLTPLVWKLNSSKI